MKNAEDRNGKQATCSKPVYTKERADISECCIESDKRMEAPQKELRNKEDD